MDRNNILVNIETGICCTVAADICFGVLSMFAANEASARILECKSVEIYCVIFKGK